MKDPKALPDSHQIEACWTKKRCLSSLTVGGDLPPPLFDASSKGLPGSALQFKA